MGRLWRTPRTGHRLLSGRQLWHLLTMARGALVGPEACGCGSRAGHSSSRFRRAILRGGGGACANPEGSPGGVSTVDTREGCSAAPGSP